jgi:two-component system sensor histidine kinase VicK
LTEILVHDLRNPLTAVNGYLDLLERALRDGKQQAVEDFLQGARENTEDLLHMITDILDISRLEAGEFRFEQEPVAVADIFAAMQHRFESMARLEGKRIIAQALPDVGVYGDRDVLLRVLANLISNAFKYTARREGKIQLTAVTDQTLDQTVITVSDNGVGIPTDMHEKIFEKFVQVPESGDRRGFGLGLAFCKMAVEALGGTLTVNSQVGQGSNFRIALRTAPISTKPRVELS